MHITSPAFEANVFPLIVPEVRAMSAKLTVFVIYDQNKFNITVQDSVQLDRSDAQSVVMFTEFGPLFEKIVQVFRIALDKEVNTVDFFYEVCPPPLTFQTWAQIFG